MEDATTNAIKAIELLIENKGWRKPHSRSAAIQIGSTSRIGSQERHPPIHEEDYSLAMQLQDKQIKFASLSIRKELNFLHNIFHYAGNPIKINHTI